MNDQTQEMREYIKFWTKFSQKAEEILHEYNTCQMKIRRKLAQKYNRYLWLRELPELWNLPEIWR